MTDYVPAVAGFPAVPCQGEEAQGDHGSVTAINTSHNSHHLMHRITSVYHQLADE